MKTKTSLILTVAALALSGSALAEVKIALVAKSLGKWILRSSERWRPGGGQRVRRCQSDLYRPDHHHRRSADRSAERVDRPGVDAIAISANDPDAVVPVLKKAMQRGIKVVSWDSGVAPAGRQIHLNPSNNA
jgi:rhamnose transport system substrate-binding protein